MYSSTNNSSTISEVNESPPPSRTYYQTQLDSNSKADKPSFSSHVDTRERKGMLPLLFERASNRIWDPSFDSTVLESEFRRFVLVVDRIRFKSAALYVATACLILTIYFGTTRGLTASGENLMIGCGVTCLVSIFFFLLTQCTNLYRKPREAILISLLFVLLIVSVEVLSFYKIAESELTYTFRFTLSTCIILLIYTLIPALPMYACFLIAIFYSVAHEVSAALERKIVTIDTTEVVSKIFLHIGIHFVGLAMFFMAQVKKRSTFWRVGQSIVATRDLEIEQRMKDRMIRWVMPKVVADWLIQDGLQRIKVRGVSEPKVPFRPFNMDRVENVSILFADIVGFTKMSSNKTAETLVNLLNDLFGRFDELTEINSCEKVSTLGDCYYCVAGCPEKTRYHAICSVEMGLDIVEQIKKFREETKEDVDMRVGIHTGSVLCGILGNRRRRFDVWSNDVTIANRMEAAGRPGKVHISESTLKFLEDQYVVEKGEGISINKDGETLPTYFIVSRKNGVAGNKPWQREKAHRDSDSSLRQAIKSGMNPSKDEHKKRVRNDSLTCVSPKNEKASPNEVAFYIDDGEDMQMYQEQMLRKKSYSVAEDDSIELNFLGKSQVGAQSPPSPPKPQLRIAQNLAKTPLPFQRLNAQLNFTLNDAFMRDALRELNDKQLVKLMRRKKTQKEYFTNPPLTVVKKNFNVEHLEMKYRKECFKDFKLHPKVTTFASPKIHFFFDVITVTLLFLINLIVCYLVFRPVTTTLVILTPIVAVIMFALLLVRCIRASAMAACCPAKKCTEELSELEKENSMSSQTSHSEMQGRPSIGRLSLDGTFSVDVKKRQRTFKEIVADIATSLWFRFHVFGALMMCLPFFVTFATLHHCEKKEWGDKEIELFSNLISVGLLYFCSFTQLSYLMKTTLALIVATVFCILVRIKSATYCFTKNSSTTSANDIIVSIMIQVILVFCVNRLHEGGVRVNYFGDREAAEKKNNASDQKRVADSLLVDMFPRHVSEQLKFKSHCSRNYDNVGVLFATIVNFGEFYEENFAGGIECIRVLHELVADFDKELDKFDDLEKIKTVHGTTFMAASGLCVPDNNNTGYNEPAHPHLHLKNLIDFALAIFRVLNEFNSNMLGFHFLLRCGFNAGPVTAGVIGTTKPQYDIWGDAVNLASRMDSTGVPGRIQMPEKSMEMLTDFFTFEERGIVFVKGKNNMRTHLLCDRVKDAGCSQTLPDICLT